MVLTLSKSRAVLALAFRKLQKCQRRCRALTTRQNHPDEVHSKVVNPEVQELRTTVCNLIVVVVEHASGIVEDQAVHLADADNDLEGVAQRVGFQDHVGNDEAHWAPGELFAHGSACGLGFGERGMRDGDEQQ